MVALTSVPLGEEGLKFLIVDFGSLLRDSDCKLISGEHVISIFSHGIFFLVRDCILIARVMPTVRVKACAVNSIRLVQSRKSRPSIFERSLRPVTHAEILELACCRGFFLCSGGSGTVSESGQPYSAQRVHRKCRKWRWRSCSDSCLAGEFRQHQMWRSDDHDSVCVTTGAVPYGIRSALHSTRYLRAGLMNPAPFDSAQGRPFGPGMFSDSVPPLVHESSSHARTNTAGGKTVTVIACA